MNNPEVAENHEPIDKRDLLSQIDADISSFLENTLITNQTDNNIDDTDLEENTDIEEFLEDEEVDKNSDNNDNERTIIKCTPEENDLRAENTQDQATSIISQPENKIVIEPKKEQYNTAETKTETKQHVSPPVLLPVPIAYNTQTNTKNSSNSDTVMDNREVANDRVISYNYCMEMINKELESREKVEKIKSSESRDASDKKINLEKDLIEENLESIEDRDFNEKPDITQAVHSVIKKIRENCGSSIQNITSFFKNQGLDINSDIRFTQLNQAISKLLSEGTITINSALTDEQIYFLIIQNIDLVNQVVSRQLTIPDFQVFIEKIKSIASGFDKTEISLCSVDGQIWNSQENSSLFQINTAIRPIIYALCLNENGSDYVHRYVGQEPKPHGLSQKAMKFR